MTSKNNVCKCTQRLLHDGRPQEQGPRHLLGPQAAYVDWPKIATASFHLRFLPSFPRSYKCNSQPEDQTDSLTKNVSHFLCEQFCIWWQHTLLFLWSLWISVILPAAVSGVMIFTLLPHFICFLYFSCLSFYLFFRGFGTPEKEQLILMQELLRIIHRMCSSLGKGNGTKSLGIFWNLWAVYCG